MTENAQGSPPGRAQAQSRGRGSGSPSVARRATPEPAHDRQRRAPADVYGHRPGTVVLNHGDPLFARAMGRRDDAQLAREVFLRVVAYVPFSEVVSIPSRYILDGEAMFRATVWAAPLLEAGIVQPERRAEVDSFADLADARGVGSKEKARARQLDRIATTARPVHWKQLEATWRTLIGQDLARDGAFRNLLTARKLGAKRGRNAAKLDAVAERFSEHGRGLEDFLALVREHCPAAIERYARRWAMARYYYAPTLVDPNSVREMPEHAGRLLIRTGATTDPPHSVDTAAPAEQAYARLSVELPLFGDLDGAAQRYCQAAIRVRDELPHARRLFTARTNQQALDEEGRTVSEALEEEMRRQLRPHRRFHPWGARLGISLVSGGVGFGLSLLDPVLGTAGGAGAAVGGEAARDFLDRRARSWDLAIDRLSEYARPN